MVTIRNDSLIAANWKLVGADEENGFNCETEFTVFPMSGMLGPGKSEEITIGFHAIEKNEFDKTITLQVCMRVYVCMYICVCMYIYIYIYIYITQVVSLIFVSVFAYLGGKNWCFLFHKVFSYAEVCYEFKRQMHIGLRF